MPEDVLKEILTCCEEIKGTNMSKKHIWVDENYKTIYIDPKKFIDGMVEYIQDLVKSPAKYTGSFME